MREKYPGYKPLANPMAKLFQMAKKSLEKEPAIVKSVQKVVVLVEQRQFFQKR